MIPGRRWVVAKGQGEQLKAQELAVCVGGVDTYSTVGFFAMPILNAFLRHSDAELAELSFAVPMNNARRNAVAKYCNQVPTFEKLIKDCGYDLERFFEKVEQIGSE